MRKRIGATFCRPCRGLRVTSARRGGKEEEGAKEGGLAYSGKGGKEVERTCSGTAIKGHRVAGVISIGKAGGREIGGME